MSNSRLSIRGAAAAPLFLTFLLVTGAGALEGQVRPGSWELGFAVGSANIDSNDEDFDLDFRAELRGGYQVGDRFQIEVQLLRADALFDAELNAAMLNGVVRLGPRRTFEPYLLFGLGTYDLEDFTIFGTAPEVSEDGLAYQIGLGSRIYLGDEERMALRLEVSSLWLDFDVLNQDRFTSLTGGLSWNFGGR